MSRLTNEQLKSWALPYSTREKGDCAGVTKQLLEATFANYAGDEPTERKKKGVRIPLREKTSHVGVLLSWHATGEEVIVDATIQQAMEINDRPVVIDFVVGADAQVWPMVAAGASNDDIITAQAHREVVQ